MDVSAIGCFYGSVARFPEGFAIPPGGLARFLREDLHAKVFLISSGVFNDHWATHTRKMLMADELFNIRGCILPLEFPFLASQYYAASVRQNELRALFSRYNMPTEASWMLYLIQVLLHAVGFEGDNGPVERGVGPLQMALAQTEFLLLKCSESFMIQRSMDKTGFLDYEEYDPHCTVEMYFALRRAPELYEKVPVGAASIPESDIGKRLEYWTEAERVVEAILVALLRCNIPIRVQTYQDGEVISICCDSIDGVIADMVASTSPSTSRSDRSQGIREYVPSVEGSEHPMRSVAGSGYALVEEWTAGKAMPRPDTPRALNAASYSIVECFSIIGWQVRRLQVRGYGPLHVVMEHFVCPAIFLLERATEGLQIAGWRYHVSESEVLVLRACIDLVIKVVTLVTVSAGRFPTSEEITRGVCLDASTASLRGKDLSGLLRLHILLLSFYADGIPPVPPADLDLWLSRGLIIAHSWELVEHISEYAVFLRDSAEALLIGVE
ncbi:hypothetical protein DFH07DRAFT_765251 [Mycena maculata]|uniref:Uncharacterized protein n=1 Tax=Mycena maculata TaxID=230809 RepID=A0AAD7K8R0_9AGAR|nr:hypothetical protein DFH07DRAFT_765251 [Mycena maculata]